MTQADVFPDEYINAWADIFMERKVHHFYGIEFSVFINNPESIMRNISGEFSPIPLLTKQRDVSRRILEADISESLQNEIENEVSAMLQQEVPAVEYRNGQFIEPFRHTSQPRRKPGHFSVRPQTVVKAGVA